MNLVERLREGAVNEFTDYGNLCDEAADRIEALEAALNGIAPWLSASLEDYEHDGKREYGKACDAVFLALNKGKDQ